MPNITNTLSQVFIDRVLLTFPPASTIADIEEWQLDQLKSRVQHVEANEAKDAKYNAVGAEDWKV